jgi:hypothetical protein
VQLIVQFGLGGKKKKSCIVWNDHGVCIPRTTSASQLPARCKTSASEKSSPIQISLSIRSLTTQEGNERYRHVSTAHSWPNNAIFQEIFEKSKCQKWNCKLPTRRLEQSEIFCEIRKQHDFLNLRLNLVWSGKKLTLNVPAHQITFFVGDWKVAHLRQSGP